MKSPEAGLGSRFPRSQRRDLGHTSSVVGRRCLDLGHPPLNCVRADVFAITEIDSRRVLKSVDGFLNRFAVKVAMSATLSSLRIAARRKADFRVKGDAWQSNASERRIHNRPAAVYMSVRSNRRIPQTRILLFDILCVRRAAKRFEMNRMGCRSECENPNRHTRHRLLRCNASLWGRDACRASFSRPSL